jgi:hypothetical protein
MADTKDARRLANAIEISAAIVAADGWRAIADETRQAGKCLTDLADEVDRLKAELAKVKTTSLVVTNSIPPETWKQVAGTITNDRVTDALGGRKDGVSYGD